MTDALASHRTQSGETLAHLAAGKRLLVVFLRHAGCPFCREALARLSAERANIEAAGATIVLVHMASDNEAQELFARYDLADVPRISDPSGGLYEAFGLARGSIWQIMRDHADDSVVVRTNADVVHAPGVATAERENGGYRITFTPGSGPHELLAWLAAQRAEVEEFRHMVMPLEDVFVRVVETSGGAARSTAESAGTQEAAR